MIARFPKTQAAMQARVLYRMAAFYGRWLLNGRRIMAYDTAPAPARTDVELNDETTALVCRAILERRYFRVVEIGTYSGARIATVKRLFPHVEAIGLDLQFGAPIERDGVTFRKFDTATLPHGALIFCHHTLVCFNAGELRALLQAAKLARCDVLFVEPTAGYRNAGHSRRNAFSWFHDYDAEFAACGFKMLGTRDAGTSTHFDIKAFEMRYANLFSPK